MIVHTQEIDQVQLEVTFTEAHIVLREIIKEAQISMDTLSTTRIAQVVVQDQQTGFQETIEAHLGIEIDQETVATMGKDSLMELRMSEMWRDSHHLRLRQR